MTRDAVRKLVRYRDVVARAIRSQLAAAEHAAGDQAIVLALSGGGDGPALLAPDDPCLVVVQDLRGALAVYVGQAADPVQHIRDEASTRKRLAETRGVAPTHATYFLAIAETARKSADELARRIERAKIQRARGSADAAARSAL